MASPDAASALPEHWSWFSLLPDSAQHALEDFAGIFNAPVANALGGDPHEKWFFGGQYHALHMFAFLFVLAIMVFIGLRVKSRHSDPKDAVIPEAKLSVANFAELFSSAIYKQMSDVMDKERAKYFMPLIGTCAFVIFFSNVLGLIPGFLPPTDNLNTTAAMAVVIFIATHVYGIKAQGFGPYVKHFLGPVWWLAWLILPIEIVSHFVRPVTLAIRLTANMFADHAVLGAFLGLAAGAGLWSAAILPVPVYILGCIVVTVQTIVFCLLSMVYIGSATEPHHDDHH